MFFLSHSNRHLDLYFRIYFLAVSFHSQSPFSHERQALYIHKVFHEFHFEETKTYQTQLSHYYVSCLLYPIFVVLLLLQHSSTLSRLAFSCLLYLCLYLLYWLFLRLHPRECPLFLVLFSHIGMQFDLISSLTPFLLYS